MIHATVTVHHDHPLGDIDPMIYGQYIEHMHPDHHVIYGAIVDEGSDLSDARGYRLDVIEAVRELHVPVVRWPGGCFADLYHWEDGIGPRERRPTRRNLHWGGTEPNTFGTHEFLDWAERIDTRAYVNLNIGSGTLDEAVRWVDYCTGTEPTAEVLRRRANGRERPWTVPYWGVGNEQWGPWEAGHTDAATYAETLRDWTQYLRKVDPAGEFVGIGSDFANDPVWDLTVMLHAGHLIDWLTVHTYGHTLYDGTDRDFYPTVTFPVQFERRLERLIAIVRAGNSTLGNDREVRISIDEWNIRHMRPHPATGKPVIDRESPRTLQDAVAAAGVFHAMLRHPCEVGMANYVFLCNANGVLLVHPAGIVKTPLFDLFAVYRRLLVGTSLETVVTGDRIDMAVRTGFIGKESVESIACIDAVTTRRDGGIVHAIVNRHRREAAEVTIVGSAFAHGAPATLHLLTHADPLAKNDTSHPDAVRMTTEPISWTGTLTIPPHSVAIVEFPG